MPTSTSSGTYSLIIGSYRRDTGVRLQTPDGKDALTVTTITIR